MTTVVAEWRAGMATGEEMELTMVAEAAVAVIVAAEA